MADIGIIVPAHNEAESIAACLDALILAAAQTATHGHACEIIVVLDSCTDTSADIVRSYATRHYPACSIRGIERSVKNVGIARAEGVRALQSTAIYWLAFTDGDSFVSPDWLLAQLALGADAVCGTVKIDDWSAHGVHADMLAKHFAKTYQDRDGHRHIHGANLGVSAEMYRRVGGFPPLDAHEDVTFVQTLIAAGARIAWSAAPAVTTSARTDFRARRGLGNTLLAVVEEYLNHGTTEHFVPPI